MKIAGIEKCSFVDWPGKICAVIFTPGCNMNCYFCHNRSILSHVDYLLEPASILSWLDKRKGLLDGVTISGGEPTLQKDLAIFIGSLRKRGFSVKLDTNGLGPHILEMLLDEKLIDYVAMDIKGPEEKYSDIAGVEIEQDVIDTSIDIIMRKAPDYEFRTTVVPELSEEDIIKIARRIKNAKRYFLQQYRIPDWVTRRNEEPRYPFSRQPHSYNVIQQMAVHARLHVACCETRGIIDAFPGENGREYSAI